ncbi:MAG: hypothetical protein IMY67_00735 [Bacteroidetes bacterium]|nr:hypothetical protein [Bacteroidota bacterium]
MIFIELNEFNFELLEIASEKYNLPNIKKILKYNKTKTITDDVYNSGYLEPWVQWVSIHTGLSSTKHQIQNLGDIPKLEVKQLWEKLSDSGISTGIWGVMNGSRGNASYCNYFVPDPWSFSEKAYPDELNDLLSLPRYISKNYLSYSKYHSICLFRKLISRVVKSIGVVPFVKSFRILLKGLFKFKFKHFVFISWFEYLSVSVFTTYHKKKPSELSIIFINTLAHLQHHYWVGGKDSVSEEILFGLTVIDEMLSILISLEPKEESVLVANGLSQKNTNKDPPWILYRPKNPLGFIKAAGLNVERIEPLMTHDAHLFFCCKEDCVSAHNILSGARVKNKKLFFVQMDDDDKLKLFYRIDYTDLISDDECLTINNLKLKFYHYFKAIVVRTGKHIPEGVLLSCNLKVEDEIYNHEISKVIIQHLERGS